MQPINYMLDVQSPLQAAMAGYAQGQGLKSQQQGMEMQRELMDMKRTEFQQAQQQIAQQQARAQEVQAMMAQFAEQVRMGDVTAEDVIQMQFAVPEMAESIQQAWETLDTAQKDGKIRDYAKLAVALKRNPEVAMQLIDERILAAENAGDIEQRDLMRAIRAQAEMNPEAVLSSALMEMATVMDKDQFKNFMEVAMPRPADAASVEGKIMQDYQAGMFGPVGSPEAQRLLTQALDRARGPQTVVNVGDTLSPGLKKQDELFAQVAVDWQTGGGADSVKQATQLADTLDRLAAGENLTGPVVGQLPDFVLAFVNPESIDAREAVEEVVQRNLRLILGAQFTQREGELLIRRAYNPKLSPQVNAKRVSRLFRQMEVAADQKQRMVDYFSANGTLQGYTGPVPTISSFEQAIEGPRGAGDLPTVTTDAQYEALPSGAEFIGDDGKRYRKP